MVKMVSHRIPGVTKPSRSDEVLDPHEQLLIADQIRSQFESLTPKRPPKPDRSDPDSFSSPAPDHSGAIPELEKLQSLRSQSQPVIPIEGGGGVIEEDFVETSYYDGLIAIDKQHHTTGTGFIRAVKEGDDQNGYDLPRNLENGEKKVIALGLRGNPAMNDWTPSFEDDQDYVSSKPIRSG